VPVVTPAGALPEVVGDVGVVVERHELVDGIREALDAGEERRRAARERVLTHFSVAQRREGLHALVERALAPSWEGGLAKPGPD
jgi:glycosyltransferase involved in cell wall biosynthesis